MTDPRSQSQYQVRFAYGDEGMRELADADLLVVANQLGGGESGGDPEAVTVATASTVVDRVLAAQAEKGDRVSVAVVARGSDGVSFAVSDILAAGAVVDALGAAGIDHCSPEAAAVGAAYAGLKHATRHLVSASVSSRLARESGGAT